MNIILTITSLAADVNWHTILKATLLISVTCILAPYLRIISFGARVYQANILFFYHITYEFN